MTNQKGEEIMKPEKGGRSWLGKQGQGSEIFLDLQDIARRRTMWVKRVGCGLVQCSTGRVWFGIFL